MTAFTTGGTRKATAPMTDIMMAMAMPRFFTNHMLMVVWHGTCEPMAPLTLSSTPKMRKYAIVLEPPNWANRKPPTMSRMADSTIDARAPFFDTRLPMTGASSPWNRMNTVKPKPTIVRSIMMSGCVTMTGMPIWPAFNANEPNSRYTNPQATTTTQP